MNGPPFKQLIKKVICKLTRFVFFKRELLILEAPMIKISSRIETLGLRAEHDDPEFLEHVKKRFPEKYRLFKNRLAKGIYCGRVYSRENTLVAYGWVAFGEYYEPWIRHTFLMRPNQIYQFDGFIEPEFRKGMLSFILNTIFWDHFLKKGYTTAVAAVDRENAGNLALHTLMQFKETGEKIIAYHIFGFPFSVSKTYSKDYFK
jgi:L-amino acid N-acyltransferase YncA